MAAPYLTLGVAGGARLLPALASGGLFWQAALCKDTWSFSTKSMQASDSLRYTWPFGASSMQAGTGKAVRHVPARILSACMVIFPVASQRDSPGARLATLAHALQCLHTVCACTRMRVCPRTPIHARLKPALATIGYSAPQLFGRERARLLAASRSAVRWAILVATPQAHIP